MYATNFKQTLGGSKSRSFSIFVIVAVFTENTGVYYSAQKVV